jgi:hypothetical protein
MTTPSRVTTPHGLPTTSDEVLQRVDLHGKGAVVTGGASGIGAETARALAGQRRDPGRTQRTRLRPCPHPPRPPRSPSSPSTGR